MRTIQSKDKGHCNCEREIWKCTNIQKRLLLCTKSRPRYILMVDNTYKISLSNSMSFLFSGRLSPAAKLWLRILDVGQRLKSTHSRNTFLFTKPDMMTSFQAYLWRWRCLKSSLNFDHGWQTCVYSQRCRLNFHYHYLIIFSFCI